VSRDSLDNDAERAELAAFLARCERQWMERGNAESRREFERHIADASADYGMLVMWRGKFDAEVLRRDVAIKKAAGEANRRLSRVATVFDEYRKRKTMPVEALRVAIGTCDSCHRDAESAHRGRLYCAAHLLDVQAHELTDQLAGAPTDAAALYIATGAPMAVLLRAGDLLLPPGQAEFHNHMSLSAEVSRLTRVKATG
jgi:hypothetical protein